MQAILRYVAYGFELYSADKSTVSNVPTWFQSHGWSLKKEIWREGRLILVISTKAPLPEEKMEDFGSCVGIV